MDKNGIISELYSSSEIEKLKKSLNRQDCDDIFHHAFLELLLKPDSKIIEMHKKGYLRFYFVRIVINISKGSISNSYNKNLTKEVLVEDFSKFDIKEEVYSEDDFIKIKEIMQTINWYDEKILSMYAELGTIKKITELTGIAKTNIHNSLTYSREQIKRKFYSKD